MALSIEQKSTYLLVLNATMILRAIGKTYRRNVEKLKNFKIQLFAELEKLIKKMEKGKLREKDIIASITSLSKKCKISFGQSQKAINVILKSHYYLYEKYLNKKIKQQLHCPLDSIILNSLGIVDSLTKINKKKYLEIQESISRKISPKSKIDFDVQIWDKQHLEDEGL